MQLSPLPNIPCCGKVAEYECDSEMMHFIMEGFDMMQSDTFLNIYLMETLNSY